MTLRRRLAAWYGGLFSLVLASAFALVYLWHVGAHEADVDAGLRTLVDHALTDLAAGAQSGDGGIRGARLNDPVAMLEEPHAVWLHETSGKRPVAAAGEVREPSLAAIDPATAPLGFASTSTPTGRVRTLAVGVPGADARIVSGVSLAGIDASNAQLGRALLVLGALGTAGAIAGGSAIAGVALRPIARLTSTAASVAQSHDLARRVAVPHADDEMGRLARTFNAMLDSVERGYLAQQAFVTEVSHELRTPLTTIRGNAEMLGDTATPRERREALERIVRDTDRLSRLVRDLLAIARADGVPRAMDARPFQLDEVVLETVGDLSGTPGPHLRVEGIAPLIVSGEQNQIKEVVLGILDNAQRYTSPEGTISIDLRAEGLEAVLRVADDGIGVAATDLPHVFERFWRSEAARRHDPQGSGLGLAIAHWIIERHGGSIALAPRSPQGTTVTVRLPLATGPDP